MKDADPHGHALRQLPRGLMAPALRPQPPWPKRPEGISTITLGLLILASDYPLMDCPPQRPGRVTISFCLCLRVESEYIDYLSVGFFLDCCGSRPRAHRAAALSNTPDAGPFALWPSLVPPECDRRCWHTISPALGLVVLVFPPRRTLQPLNCLPD
ncbi:hypothetical protein PAPYR_13356 [Paratrimastix pyriformis]|uniref:Uncharacterized protein n=1 Tax=Paratrimastix pyriformis TaxID=342808 RepID=A0ABQ8U4I9_9EUKA|nr:hypothetical protein PAPYR_13356 [Paratrimastix pyriformis]